MKKNGKDLYGYEEDSVLEDLSEFDLDIMDDYADDTEAEAALPAAEISADLPDDTVAAAAVLPEDGGQHIVIHGITGAIDERAKFAERLAELGSDIENYHAALQAHLVSFRKVKSRYSTRCDSYRAGRELLAKMAVGGKTLKLYLALDPKDEALAGGKYHQRDLSGTSAYADVPFMLPIRSGVADRKAIRVIDYMMGLKQIKKRRKRRAPVKKTQG